jgi:N-methylhydantoinase A
LFGRTPPNVPTEVVSWRVRLTGPTPTLALGVSRDTDQERTAMKGERLAYFPEFEAFHRTAVYDRYRFGPGDELHGPAIVEERESTVVIGPRGRARVDDLLNLVVELV